MRWARARHEGSITYGVIEDEKFRPIQGSPFDEWSFTGAAAPWADIKLEVPVIPPTFYACGLNYAAHVRKYAELAGREPVLPAKPDPGYRANNALIAHNETIVIPHDAGPRVQYEGELVVVIGKKVKHLTEENALSAVFGYTIGNDVSERDWQQSDRTFWRSKNSDTFKPMGPWIETDIDLATMMTRVRVNGEETLAFQTRDMIFGIETFLATLTRNCTLYPGDMIWMGTDGASPNLKHGDVVEVELDGIGVLRNPIVREEV